MGARGLQAWAPWPVLSPQCRSSAVAPAVQLLSRGWSARSEAEPCACRTHRTRQPRPPRQAARSFALQGQVRQEFHLAMLFTTAKNSAEYSWINFSN